MSDVLRLVGRSARRIAVTTTGAALFLVGLALLVLPGPGLLVVVLSFAVLSTEYRWASQALERTRGYADRARRHGRQTYSFLSRQTSSVASRQARVDRTTR